jgi:hypothetical protein
MTQNKDMPRVFVAALCESVLEEKDKVLSAIRFIDRIEAVLPSDAPEEVIVPIKLAALVMMKAGPARGKRLLSLGVTDPHGNVLPITAEFPLVFTEEQQGANTVIRIVLGVKTPGIYFFNVTLDGELIAQMPLDLVLTRETEKPEQTNQT